MRFFVAFFALVCGLILTGCSSSPQTPSSSNPGQDNPSLSGSMLSGTQTTQTIPDDDTVSDDANEEEMVDDSLTVIMGDAETTCTDEFNQFVTDMINTRDDGNESVVTYLDLKLIPKINHCVLGYATSTQTAYTIIVRDLSVPEELQTFVCEADYDVDNDILTPCSDTRRQALEQEYKAYMSNFVVQNNRY